jgi:nicotinate phosphoribosyltransferase
MRLVTDLYEVSMAGSYLRRGRIEPATFSLFVRALPARRGFLVAAGLQDALDQLAALEVTSDDVHELAGVLGCDESFVRPLTGLRFTGDVLAVPEGRIVFADEPLLEVTAPLPQAQLVESIVLNALTYQTAICTKAVRCVIAAGGRPVIDFALRRTHGVEAAASVARVTAIAGFSATSNVQAAVRFGIRATGTMAHSYVQAFPDEEAAFRAFAVDVPVDPTFLVDTYDVRLGVAAAIRVIGDLGLEERSAVRLDSGDLAADARATRASLDQAGLTQVRILVSGGLDEYRIAALRASGAPIDVFAVGTAVGVSADAPSLDTAYKLVQLGDRPVCKLSTGKATAPGAKQVWRPIGTVEPPADSEAGGGPVDTGPVDTLALREEPAPDACEPLLVPVMRAGRRLADRESLADAAARLRADLSRLEPATRDLEQPRPGTVRRTAALQRLTDRLAARRSPM